MRPDPHRLGVLAFIVVFIVAYPLLTWILDGSGPVAAVNSAVAVLTRGQARLAGGLLRLGGEDVAVRETIVSGSTFQCDIEEGCNGMSAITLVLAGVLAFPVAWRRRALGLAVLLPIVLLTNIVRIAGLYWTGAHHPDLFAHMHVFVGQAVVILVTAGAWLWWLTWNAPGRELPSSA